MRRTAPWLVALGGGIAWALCFGRQGYLVAPWLALVPLVLLLDHRAAGRLGWLHGVVTWLVAVHWIRATLETYGHLAPWLAAASLLLLCLYLGAFHGLFALLGRRLWRRGGWPALAGLPALWVALELVRAHLFSGFPWNPAAHAWVEVAGALPLAGWMGAYGVSLLVVAANVGLAAALTRGRRVAGAAVVLACLLALAVAARWAAADDRRPAGGGLPVRLLQPNSPNLVSWDPVQVAENYRTIFEQSHAACDEAGALLIWPESAAWPYSFERDAEYRRDLERLVASGCPVLLNSTDERPQGFFNSLLLVEASGVAGRYDKRHLVPFGEYVPLARVFAFLQRIARSAGDYVPGSEPAVLGWRGEALGPAICFEVIFPAEVAETVRAGATLLVTVTNDAWYGDTSAPWQHLTAARFRAAESRRTVLRAAITGVSAVIGPDGALDATLGVGERGVLRARVAGRSELTPHSRHPWLVPLGCAAVAALGLAGTRRRG